MNKTFKAIIIVSIILIMALFIGIKVAINNIFHASDNKLYPVCTYDILRNRTVVRQAINVFPLNSLNSVKRILELSSLIDELIERAKEKPEIIIPGLVDYLEFDYSRNQTEFSGIERLDCWDKRTVAKIALIDIGYDAVPYLLAVAPDSIFSSSPEGSDRGMSAEYILVEIGDKTLAYLKEHENEYMNRFMLDVIIDNIKLQIKLNSNNAENRNY